MTALTKKAMNHKQIDKTMINKNIHAIFSVVNKNIYAISTLPNQIITMLTASYFTIEL